MVIAVNAVYNCFDEIKSLGSPIHKENEYRKGHYFCHSEHAKNILATIKLNIIITEYDG